jgi:hypothetical protein
MRDIGKRIERLEEALQDQACVCKRVDSGYLVVGVEQNATPEEVEAAKAVHAVDCPVHGRHIPAFILVLRGSDRDA